jgi:branched-chain amino acid transport system permease protein
MKKLMTSPKTLKFLIFLTLFGLIPAVLKGIGSGYLFQIVDTSMVFVILAVSLNYVTGTVGLLSLGHAAFYGVGAYTAAILATRLAMPFYLTLPLSGIVAAALGCLLALPTMRLVSIYFAVATLGLGEMIYVTILNWVDLTRGPMGITGIPPISFFGYNLKGPLEIYYVVAAVTAFSVWVVHRLTHSYFGNAMRSVREDDQCAEGMGINVVKLKIQAFVVSTFFAGLAGGLMAHFTGFISPDFFRFGESILILSMVVVGGLGSIPGAVIGAVLLILLPEAGRGIGDFRMILVGMVMFFSILLLPKGMFGEISAIDLMRRHFGSAWSKSEKRLGWR